MATVTILTTELATVNKKLVINFQAKRGSPGGHGRAARGRGYGAGPGDGAVARTGAGSPALADMVGGVDLEPPIQYYWTYGPGCRHNSAKLPKPVAGHI